jgi:hypothetical protein
MCAVCSSHYVLRDFITLLILLVKNVVLKVRRCEVTSSMKYGVKRSACWDITPYSSLKVNDVSLWHVALICSKQAANTALYLVEEEERLDIFDEVFFIRKLCRNISSRYSSTLLSNLISSYECCWFSKTVQVIEVTYF